MNTTYYFTKDGRTIKDVDVLRYGEIITDDEFFPIVKMTRIRTIKYNNHVYYYKQIDGNVEDFIEII